MLKYLLSKERMREKIGEGLKKEGGNWDHAF